MTAATAPVMEQAGSFAFISRRIDEAIAHGARVQEAVDRVLAEYEQDDEALRVTSRLGWISLKNQTVSAERYGGAVETGGESESRLGHASGRSQMLNGRALMGLRVRYVGADNEMKSLLTFTLADWRKFDEREAKIERTVSAKRTAAAIAISAFGKNPKAIRTDQLPVNALRALDDAVETFRRLEKD